MTGESESLAEAAGAERFAEAEMDKLRREHEQTIAVIVEEMELALQKKDEEMRMRLTGESERSRKEIDELHKQRKMMFTLLSDERELRREERERMESEMAKFRVGMEELERRQRDELDLRDAGYDPRGGQDSATRALSAAVRSRRDLRILRLLLAKGANPVSCVAQPSWGKRGALHVAAEVGYAEAVGIFTEGDATELDIADGDGDTALMWAAWGGHEAVVDMLLAKGAKPDSKTRSGETSLIYAASQGYEAVVRLLLANGAKPDIAEIDGVTALIYAAEHGHEAIVGLLLTNGAKQDLMTNAGDTALMLAIRHGNDPVVRVLRAHAAGLDSFVSIQSVRN